jgi:hypothetical protein
MQKIFLTSFFLTLLCYQGFSQKSEVGVSLGGSLFSGDVNPDYARKETKPSFGLLYRYFLSKKFTLRSTFLFSTLSGDDYKDMSWSVKEGNYKVRNLSFRSRIIELSIGAEYFLKNLTAKKSSPYVFAGIGGFYFKPQAKYQGKWYDLQPLGTEGQGLPGGYPPKYKRLQANWLVGLGYKQKLSPKVSLSFEVGLRFTSTDYIDDVSTTYADKGALRANGSMSPILADRSAERDYEFDPYVATGPIFPKSQDAYGYSSIQGYGQPGDQRGNPKNKDKYLIYNLTLSYRFFFIGTPNHLED